MTTHELVITIETPEQRDKILGALEAAEHEGVLDFDFGVTRSLSPKIETLGSKIRCIRRQLRGHYLPYLYKAKFKFEYSAMMQLADRTGEAALAYSEGLALLDELLGDDDATSDKETAQ